MENLLRAIIILALLTACAEDPADHAPAVSSTEETPDQMEAAALAMTGSPWVLVFNDEFNGTAVDQTKWRIVDQELNANGAVNNYNPAMVSVSGGSLHLQVQHIPWRGKAYSGGELDTLHHQVFQYGLFSARMKAACGSGLHSSWWLWPDNNVWPPEIDIAEVRGVAPMQVKTTLHWPAPNNTPIWGILHEVTSTLAVSACADYHTYMVDWQPHQLTWYIDGHIVHTTTEHVPQTPMRLELDLALDAYAGGIDGSTHLPALMLVDYVRIFRRAS